MATTTLTSESSKCDQLYRSTIDSTDHLSPVPFDRLDEFIIDELVALLPDDTSSYTTPSTFYEYNCGPDDSSVFRDFDHLKDNRVDNYCPSSDLHNHRRQHNHCYHRQLGHLCRQTDDKVSIDSNEKCYYPLHPTRYLDNYHYHRSVYEFDPFDPFFCF